MQEMKTMEIDVGDSSELSDLIEKILTKISLERTLDPLKWRVTFPYKALCELTSKQRLQLIVYLSWFFRLATDTSDVIKTESKSAPSYAV